MPKSPDLTVCLPQLAIAEGQLRQYADGNGITYRLADYGGFRTEVDTAEILGFRINDYAAARARGEPDALRLSMSQWRPISPYGTSYHNFGAAFDLNITHAEGYPTLDDALHDLKNVASMFGLRSDIPRDPGHFELAVPLDTARKMWTAYNGGVVLKSTTGSNALVIAVIAALLFALRKR